MTDGINVAVGLSLMTDGINVAVGLSLMTDGINVAVGLLPIVEIRIVFLLLFSQSFWL